MKKRNGIIVAITAYIILSVMVCMGVFAPKQTDIITVPNEAVKPYEAPDSVRDFSMVENNLEYVCVDSENIYTATDELLLTSTDRKSIIEYYNLPELVRMAEEDASEKMNNLQVFMKMEALGISPKDIENPEFNWKSVYNQSITHVQDALMQEREVAEFTGVTASELNAFIAAHVGKTISIKSDYIDLNTTIRIPSNTYIYGNGAEVTTDTQIEYAILMEKSENVIVRDIRLTGGFDRGIYVIECKNVLLYKNEVENAAYKAIFVMGTNEYIHLIGNSIHDNAYGAVFLEGNISKGIIQHNTIYQNRGTRNLGAGLVLCSVNLTDLKVPYEQEYGIDDYLYDMLDAPHDLVIKDNMIYENYSSGIYSDGAYMNYIIDNVIKDNEKEGMCLDFGTFGTYIDSNIVERNGDRNRQSDEDLEKDFVIGLGRLEDGSSTAKLPGISIDNAAYVIITNNSVSKNAGSGIKMVRSGYRNVILCNVVSDNNAGQNDAFHGFGIELGHASKPDQVIKGLDFTADYENIIARNVISGQHYSGIYIGEGSYCNDLIDNVIMDCKEFSVENFSDLFNSAVGNNTNVGTLNFNLNQ